jgi:hypothetical protein
MMKCNKNDTESVRVDDVNCLDSGAQQFSEAIQEGFSDTRAISIFYSIELDNDFFCGVNRDSAASEVIKSECSAITVGVSTPALSLAYQNSTFEMTILTVCCQQLWGHAGVAASLNKFKQANFVGVAT